MGRDEELRAKTFQLFFVNMKEGKGHNCNNFANFF